ncbi:MAG: thymidine kinase [Christensenellales bacterium]
MAKLYFKYGTMGSSKTAQALITKFNYEERGMKTVLIKPSVDTRDGKNICKSRIGLSAEALTVNKSVNLFKLIRDMKVDVVIVDECQFLTEDQVDQLADVVMEMDVPVLCFGLRADFQTHLFPGSKRLFEIADSITEIKYICECGNKAVVNARLDESGRVVTEGSQVLIGGNDRYVAMCRKCWLKKIKERQTV